MLKDKVVAVIGGMGNIGKAFCYAIIKNRGKVIIGDVENKKTRNFVNSIDSGNAYFVEVDITKREQIDKYLQSGLKKYGKIDCAVNCSYPMTKQWGAKFEKLQPNDLKDNLFNQLGSSILFSQVFIKYFLKNGGGNLVLLSSIHGLSAPKFNHYKGTDMSSPIEYGAIKAGIISITRYLAKYYSGENIRVNCISPGGILNNQPQPFLSSYKTDCTSKGMLDADDLSGTLIYLLSNQSKYLNGQNIVVDDGWIL